MRNDIRLPAEQRAAERRRLQARKRALDNVEKYARKAKDLGASYGEVQNRAQLGAWQ